eukprot:m.106857 g.106857  ORF g.106857 m.106857 type:complete len:607 (-) comp12724_c0_seq2:1803-3623(-)
MACKTASAPATPAAIHSGRVAASILQTSTSPAGTVGRVGSKRAQRCSWRATGCTASVQSIKWWHAKVDCVGMKIGQSWQPNLSSSRPIHGMWSSTLALVAGLTMAMVSAAEGRDTSARWNDANGPNGAHFGGSVNLNRGQPTVTPAEQADACSDLHNKNPPSTIVGLGHANDLESCVERASAHSSATTVPVCKAACWYRAPANKTLAQQCYCHVDALWMPKPDATVDSARLVWPCLDNSSCSFNGHCDSSTQACVCRSGWRGPACGELDLLPVSKTQQGYRPTNPDGSNVSSWGMPALWDATTGEYHGWASEMEYGCGINAWESNSRIVHTVAANPLGPYRRVAEVWPVFAHEPDVVRGPSGEWVMMYSGYPYNATGLAHVACTNCTDGSTPPPGTPNCPFQRGQPSSLGHKFQQMLAIAPGPNGPWTQFEIPGLTAGWDWNTALTINADGSAVALIRAGFVWHASNYSDASTWHSVGGSPEGPGWQGASVEDPYIWRDEAGVYHALAHAFFPFYGVHAYATPDDCPSDWTNGKPMNWTVTGVAYTDVIEFTDGSNISAARRERPHLIWGKEGTTPIALSNGVQPGGKPNEPNTDAVTTIVQPLRL